ncbi:MAG TPA: glycoside hydrolase family 2 TIM barrel-domain containing protein [Oscillospiraceae bacterium]|nr:glycoside hydrolase family 2 TIM barrel-domain containing protein [Oscillospiraceae bacterium]
MKIMRTEYPRPQFCRPAWRNLNGEWDFEFDFGDSGEARGLAEKEYSQKINVPFCPESKLSGIKYTDFMNAVWYRRTFKLTKDELSGRILLHFGAVDYEATVWLNGEKVGMHKGGYVSFALELTKFAKEGENTLVVRARDDNRRTRQPRGKQSELYASHGCDYTRTTGIWQTVWLEFLPDTYMTGVRVFTNYKNGAVSIEISIDGCKKDLSARVTASLEGKTIDFTEQPCTGTVTRLDFTVENPKLWAPGSPTLYDVKYELIRAGKVIDTADGYFGIRTIESRGHGLYLNGKPLFMRTVLDQGFWPDGVYTAPTDEALRRDIELAQAIGFNGARLHQRVFEERWLYWADKMGYIVWGEHANWGMDHTSRGIGIFLPEWLEIMRRDFSHPAIIGWCPFNETWDRNGTRQDDDLLRVVYLATKAYDPTRPCIDTSGNYHVITDLYDIHDYDQRKAVYDERYRSKKYDDLYENYTDRQKKNGTPFWISEFGGARWAPGRNDGWGYGDAPRSDMEVAERFDFLTAAMQSSPDIVGYCYTQMTDIEQEQNGLYAYDRSKKLCDEAYEIIRKANLRISEFEKC